MDRRDSADIDEVEDLEQPYSNLKPARNLECAESKCKKAFKSTDNLPTRTRGGPQKDKPQDKPVLNFCPISRKTNDRQ